MADKKKDNSKSEKKDKKDSKKPGKKESQKKEKQPSKEIVKQEKQLRNFFIIMGVVALLVAGFFFIYNNSPKYDYKGVEFKTVNQKDLTVYETHVPLYNSQGEQVNFYRFYLRNHPKKIEDIPIPEELELKKFVVLNFSDNIVCDGEGNIAIANLGNLYNVLGATVKQDSNVNKTNLTCDEQGRYNYLTIKRGNETKIEQKGPACYEMTFKDCEVLDVTERYMLKMFVQTKDIKVPISNIQGSPEQNQQ